MKMTAYVPDVLELLSPDKGADTLRLIDNDEMLSVKRYSMSSALGFEKELCIANASKALHSPVEPHQLLAKGIVYLRMTLGEEVLYQLVSMPFNKFYNSFEGPALEDMVKIDPMEGVERKIIRKMDGTLISRFVFEGEVYFATRGRIINLEDNEFWNLLKKVIAEKGYTLLYDVDFAKDFTVIGELVGPSNVIIEFHPEDDFVITGLYSHKLNVFKDVSGLEKYYPTLKIVEEYSTDADPDEFVESWEDIREGVIVNFIKGDNVILRTKVKQAAYLNLVRAKNAVSKENLIEMIIENRLKQWQEAENHLTLYLGNSAFFEEMLNFYKTEWDDAIAKVEDVRRKVSKLMYVADKASLEPTRKDQFFKAKELLDGDDGMAGLVMGIIGGKYDEAQAVEIIYKRVKKS